MKKPNQIYRAIGPKSPTGQAFRNAHYHPVPSLRSAFRGAEWVIAGMFSRAVLSKYWIQKFMAALATMNVRYKGKNISRLFSMIAGHNTRSAASATRRLRLG